MGRGRVMGSAPILVAVVGHTNAGKTSLLRTLTRRRQFGEVSARPGTTRHVEAVELRIDGAAALRFLDTPGLEDAPGLLDALGPLRPDATPPQRLRGFLATQAARSDFEQEAKVLRALLDVDAALYVIDCREPVVAKFRCEVEVLASCGKPVLPVLNFVAAPEARAGEWAALLADFALHAQSRFDAVAPFAGAEERLYADLRTLLPQRHAELERVAGFLASERAARQAAGRQSIADTLVAVTAMREPVEREALDDPARRAALLDAFRARVLERARQGVEQLLDVHAFSRDDAELALLPWLDGRFDNDLFHPETLRDAGRRLGKGAAVGAGIGLVADVAMAGLSLGSAAALGAAIGGAASQGFGPLGRRIANVLRGVGELSVEEPVVLVLAQRLLGLQRALAQRGHGAQSRLTLDGDVPDPQRLDAVLQALQPARAHPEWAGPRAAAAMPAESRERLLTALRALE